MSSTDPNLTSSQKPELLPFSVAGQIQSGRGLVAQQARYVAVEERDPEGWLAYLHAIASQIQFINHQGNLAGNWQAALPNPDKIKALYTALINQVPLSLEQQALLERPDFAGILAFLQMLNYPLEQYWRFTEQHQTHYYRDILLFSPKPPEPDISHLVLTLDGAETSLLIEANTLFKGGEDQAGNPLLYQTTIPRLLNQSQVDKLYTLSRYPDTEQLLLTQGLNTEQGIEIPEQGCHTFGEEQPTPPEILDEKTQAYPAIGFSLASPALYLSGGIRTLTITFTFTEVLSLSITELQTGLKIAISTADAMLALASTEEHVDKVQWSIKEENKTLELEIVLGTLFPVIGTYINEPQPALPNAPYVAFEVSDAEINEIKNTIEFIKTELQDPVLQGAERKDKEEELKSAELELKKVEQKKVNIVQQLLAKKAKKVRLNIDVKDAPGLISSNENGVLESDKPSTPFTYEPRVSTAYEFTHPELLIKPIQSASLQLHWLDAPEDWDTYYQPYLRYRHRNDATKQAEYTWPENQVDIYHSDRTTLAYDKQTLLGASSPYALTFIDDSTQQATAKIATPYADLPLDELLADEWPVWFSVQLSNNDFGHADYAQVTQYQAYREQALESIKNEESVKQSAAANKTTRTASGGNTAAYEASIELLDAQGSQIKSEIAGNANKLTDTISQSGIEKITSAETNSASAPETETETNTDTAQDDKAAEGASAEEISLMKADATANIKLAAWAQIQAENAQKAQQRANTWTVAQTKMAAETSQNMHDKMAAISATTDANNIAAATANRRAIAVITDESGEVIDDIETNDIQPQNIQPTKEIVQPPYTPTLEKVTLNYSSTIDFIAESIEHNHQIHHIHPLGRPIVNSPSNSTVTLLPEFNDRGYLYLGLSAFDTPGQCTLYFQMDPVDGHNIVDDPKVRWSYLVGSEWERFDKPESTAKIIEDSTQRLQDSGLVTFDLPAIPAQQNFMGDDLFWLRLSISENSVKKTTDSETAAKPAIYSRIRHVAAQGVAVTLIKEGVDASHYDQPLAAGRITELVEAEPRITTIEQPYPSFKGKPAETIEQLPIRASERLRHKNRALTAWDYEHLVLAKFPELYLVRCYRTDEQSTTVVVVPINYDPKILQPKVPLYLKQNIQAYVATISPYGQQVVVTDPTYLVAQLKVIIKIAPGYDADKVKVDINENIKQHMTPWNTGAEQNNRVLGDSFNLAEIAEVIERNPAVMGVAKVQSINTIKEKLEPNEIVVPAQNHEIIIMYQDTAYIEGIGVWEIEYNFKVS